MMHIAGIPETPPLTRGRHSLLTRIGGAPRNTPAYAGKTHSFSFVSLIFEKHPRLRGEDMPLRFEVDPSPETPPLTRGRPASVRFLPAIKETPPLTRGRRQRKRNGKRRGRKHPRLRGEDFCPSRGQSWLKETPPLTRGRHGQILSHGLDTRNTPAYAGKTHRCTPCSGPTWKHPRLRGEDLLLSERVKGRGETPPLTRGRRWCRITVRRFLRNTPAYAGKTLSIFSLISFLQKHPRLRGEDEAGAALADRLPETPPLTRGRREVDLESATWTRNTPAYAGKTAGLGAYRIFVRKHPRLRGEDQGDRRGEGGARETPPLTRGRPRDNP